MQDGAGDEGCMMEMDDDAVHYFSQSFHSAQSDLEIVARPARDRPRVVLVVHPLATVTYM